MTSAAEVAAPVYLTPTEVAQLLRVSVKSVCRWVREDSSMPVLKIGGTLRFRRERLERWLRDREQGPATTRRIQRQESSGRNSAKSNGTGPALLPYAPTRAPEEKGPGRP